MAFTTLNYSLAVVASKADVFLVFRLVCTKNCVLQFFRTSQIPTLLKSASDFDLLFIDMASAHLEKADGNLDSLLNTFSGRTVVLTTVNELSDYYNNFMEKTKNFFYPFTRKAIYKFLKEEAPHREEKCPGGNFLPTAAIENIPELSRIAGKSSKIEEIKKLLLLVSSWNTPVILYGESGTGKTMSARIIHELSSRRDKAFVVMNMGANKELIASDLFGTVRGAYTDARDRDGCIKMADGGTLFMDEIADLPLECQGQIFEFLDSGMFHPLGSDKKIKSDVRLIFATNANLERLVEEKKFRDDLYWRIVHFPINIPPLRERTEDIPFLVEAELEEIKRTQEKSFTITDKAVQKMQTGYWKGNIRQLKACIRRATILAQFTGIIDESLISL